jgi:hypothetical protein
MTPDSSLRNDTPLDRKQLQDLYTFLANDPSINRQYLNEKLALKYHLDPSRLILPPDQVPKPQPEPVMPSVAIKDLVILTDPLVLAFIGANPQWGIQIPPEVKAMVVAMAQAQDNGQQPHGGNVAAVPSLDKHAADLTGGMQGSGALSPGLAGGQVQ